MMVHCKFSREIRPDCCSTALELLLDSLCNGMNEGGALPRRHSPKVLRFSIDINSCFFSYLRLSVCVLSGKLFNDAIRSLLKLVVQVRSCRVEMFDCRMAVTGGGMFKS